MSNNQNVLYALEWFDTNDGFKLEVTSFNCPEKALEYVGQTKAKTHCVSTVNPLAVQINGSEE